MNSMDNEKSKCITRAFMGILILIAVIFLVFDFIKGIYRHIASDYYHRCQINSRKIGETLETYAKEHDDKYPERLSLLIPKYISEIPACPGAKRDTYSSGYQISRDFRSFTFYCEGHFHRKIGINENYPLYSSKTGFWMHRKCQDLLEPVSILKYAIKMKSPNAVERLIFSNPDWVKTDKDYGSAALFRAVSKNNKDMVIFLLKNGADVNVVSDYRETPLKSAIENKNLEIVNILLSFGARIDEKILIKAKQSGNKIIYDIILKKSQSKQKEGSEPGSVKNRGR